MCIIIVKQKTDINLPTTEQLQTCFYNNPDGAGISYTNKNNQVVIEKGFMQFKDLNKRLKTLYKEYNHFVGKALLLHFRIGTAGENDEGNCHPFPITYDYNVMRKTRLVTNVAFMHNGILHDYNPTKGHNVSDTMIFNKQVLYTMQTLNRNFLYSNLAQNLLANLIGYSKMAFLDASDNVIMIGDFIQAEGLHFSNTTYKPAYIYSNYSKSLDVWDDYEKTENSDPDDAISYCDTCGENHYYSDLIYCNYYGEKLYICKECYNAFKATDCDIKRISGYDIV